MSFIDPDHDYPYASGCCDSDHNRNDGDTFLHIKHDRNQRYLIEIAAFDKLNTDSATYNGPYTITMTDIAGTERVASNLYQGTSTQLTSSVGTSRQYAVSFTTSDHPVGYKLDRIRTHIPDWYADPELALHVNTSSDEPGANLCGFRNPKDVQHHLYWEVFPAPVTFLAPACAEITLAASTTYWIVFAGSGYQPVVTDTDYQFTDRSGWTIGDVAAVKTTGDWGDISGGGTIPVEIWAKERNRAEGDPLPRGERKVGATLTADIGGITDTDGLTDPMFEYLWARRDGDTLSPISGATSKTYTLTDDDVGTRIFVLVTFRDDADSEEILSGPPTSLIAAEPRLLVGNFGQTDDIADTTRNVSSGFVSGTHQLGYAIDSITMERSGLTSASSDEAEFRLFTSTLNSDPHERRPVSRIMTIKGPDRVNGRQLTFNAQSGVKLSPSATYHVVMTTSTSGTIGCTVLGDGKDSGSLAGFDIIGGGYEPPDWTTAIIFNDRSCIFAINGFESVSSSFVKSLEFTSSPTQAGMYATGEVIEATATLSEAVTFEGPPPALLLRVGDNERKMKYAASASSATEWVFRYTVTAADRDDDGVSFERNALRGYADADLSNRPTRDDREHHVNAVPRVVSRRVSSQPIAPIWYGPGEQIQFTMGFSLPVTVVGDPQMEFNVTTPEPETEFAPYLSGSGTRELVFSYTVRNGDDDDDGIWLDADSLRLDSDDSITGVYNGLDAVLDHTALNKLTSHRIDQNPRAVSQEVTSDPAHGSDSDTYGADDAITFAVVFNQVVTVTGDPRLRFSVTGPGDEFATYQSGSGTNTLVFSYTVLATETDTDGIYLYADPLDYPDSNADSIVGAGNNLPAVNEISGQDRRLSDHKIDGTITN